MAVMPLTVHGIDHGDVVQIQKLDLVAVQDRLSWIGRPKARLRRMHRDFPTLLVEAERGSTSDDDFSALNR